MAIGPLLSARLGGVPVTVENDLNAAALGAADLLGLRDMALLALGTGVAAGLVLDGRLRRGHAGAAGEIGHLPYRPGGPGVRVRTAGVPGAVRLGVCARCRVDVVGRNAAGRGVACRRGVACPGGLRRRGRR